MPMRLGSPLPKLEGATDSIHAEGFAADHLTGQPTLIHFWSVSCHICHEVMPAVTALRDRYREQGLKVVGIHMPKEEGDLDRTKVEGDVARYHLTHPLLIDNMHLLAEQFQNQFVPAFFLFDAQGSLLFRAAGDKGLQNLAPKLEQLFGATIP